MKKIILILSVALSFNLSSCMNNRKCMSGNCSHTNCKHHAAKEKVSDHAHLAYDCPMHCDGAASDKPGNCPVCKMSLQEVKK